MQQHVAKNHKCPIGGNSQQSFIKKVATFNCQGSQTGKEVRSDLFFYVKPFAYLAGVEQNLNGSSKFTGY